MTDISAFGFANDVEFAAYLVKDVGIACVPGSSSTSIRKTAPNRYVSPSAKSLRPLDEAARRLEKAGTKVA